jgi:hypothetical protein
MGKLKGLTDMSYLGGLVQYHKCIAQCILCKKTGMSKMSMGILHKAVIMT